MLYICKTQNLSCLNLLSRNESCIAYEYPANCILIEAFNWDRAFIVLWSIHKLKSAFDEIFGWWKLLKINLLPFYLLCVYILIIPLLMNASFFNFLKVFSVNTNAWIIYTYNKKTGLFILLSCLIYYSTLVQDWNILLNMCWKLSYPWSRFDYWQHYLIK